MALVLASYHFPVQRKMTTKFVPCKCTWMVKVVMHASVLGNVSTAFLHNRAAESHEIWWDCSTYSGCLMTTLGPCSSFMFDVVSVLLSRFDPLLKCTAD